jgi:beta-glucoside operon transcriptional antiterminator
MKVEKVINNNVLSAFNEQNQELVIMGRGIAFQKKPGDLVDEQKIEKVFLLKDNEIKDRFKTLLYEIPIEYMEVTEEIIHSAKVRLGRELNESIYVSLSDHIHFAIERTKNGLQIKNSLLWEIKRLYKGEFEIGKEALKKIKNKMGTELPEDEAGFIAMHLVNAELNEEMPTMINITKAIEDILAIVNYHFGIRLNEDSLNYYRFVTHLKFFAQRLFSKTYMEDSDNFLFETVKNKYQDAYACTLKIKEYIRTQHEHELTNEEMLYLMIHIERVVKRK